MKGSLYLDFILLRGRLYVGEWCGLGHFDPNATLLDLIVRKWHVKHGHFDERVTASSLYIVL